MIKCPSHEELRQFLESDAALPTSRRELIDAHIERCKLCEKLLNGWTSPDDPAGTTVPELGPNGYRVRKLLGSGRFGEVWLAHDLNLPRAVALKTIRERKDAEQRDTAIETLRNEAGLLTGLDHPNLVRLYAWLTVRNEHYLVMRYVAGGSLSSLLRDEGPLHWQRAARYIADVSEALVGVHESRLVHRDVKPANILWDPVRDEAVLTDFGIAARLEDPIAISGSLPYMAPEAFDGHVGSSLDVYSLAATLFHLVTGFPPYAGPNIDAFVEQAKRGLPDPEPRCETIPEPLEHVIRSGLESNHSRRVALAEFQSQLRAVLNHLSVDAFISRDAPTNSHAPAQLQIRVSRKGAQGHFTEVKGMRAKRVTLTRDITKVPRPPERVPLRTSDELKVEVIPDRDGYITVFNIGPTGNLNLLHPESPDAPMVLVPGGSTLAISELQLSPPVGQERLFAIWSRDPAVLTEIQMRSYAGGKIAGASRAYAATRDIMRIQSVLQSTSKDNHCVFVLELDHVE